MVQVFGNYAIDPAGKVLQSIPVLQLPPKVQRCEHQWTPMGSNAAANRLTCTLCGLRAIKYHNPHRCVWEVADLAAEKQKRDESKQKKAAAKAKADQHKAEVMKMILGSPNK